MVIKSTLNIVDVPHIRFPRHLILEINMTVFNTCFHSCGNMSKKPPRKKLKQSTIVEGFRRQSGEKIEAEIQTKDQEQKLKPDGKKYIV